MNMSTSFDRDSVSLSASHPVDHRESLPLHHIQGGGPRVVPFEATGGLSKSEFFERYLVESKIIGQGSFAVVRKCKRTTDDAILAMKIIKKATISKASDMELIRREIAILMALDHPNVITVHDWCETKNRLFIVLDFCGGGNVLDRIMAKGSFSEFETAVLVRDIAAVFEYIHERGVVHRDVKLENIMFLDDGDGDDKLPMMMKLIDFGMANTLQSRRGTEMHTACGSPLYAAPEILKNEHYGTAVDIWSLGVVTYLLLCGFPPFFDRNGNIKTLYVMQYVDFQKCFHLGFCCIFKHLNILHFQVQPDPPRDVYISVAILGLDQ